MFSGRTQSLFSVDQVKRLYGEINGGCTISAYEIQRIVSAARQSEDYFKSAKLANSNIKPLLLYYGVSNLSYAYLKVRDCRLEPRKGHGLSIQNSSILDNKCLKTACEAISNLKISFSEGVFKSFAEKTVNRSATNSLGIKMHVDFVDYKPPSFKEVDFIDILKREKNILSSFYETSCVQIDSFDMNGDNITYTFRSGVNKEFLDYYTDRGFIFREDKKSCNVIDCIWRKYPFQLSHYFDTPTRIPALFATYPIKCDQYFSQKLNLYIISYVMGMLSRYYPAVWNTVMSGSNGDQIWPVLLNAQKIILLHYPNIISKELESIL